MPVNLDEPAADDSMDPTKADPRSPKRLLIPAPDEVLLVQPASPSANSVNNDGPQFIIAT